MSPTQAFILAIPAAAFLVVAISVAVLYAQKIRDRMRAERRRRAAEEEMYWL